jgi:hypothetical protein
MNSGDWVESLSALVEDYFGNWKIIYYSELLEEERKVTLNGQTINSTVKMKAVNTINKPLELRPVKLKKVKTETIV